MAVLKRKGDPLIQRIKILEFEMIEPKIIRPDSLGECRFDSPFKARRQRFYSDEDGVILWMSWSFSSWQAHAKNFSLIRKT